jgi:sugar phosphate isomerase/epimerase
VPLDGVTFGCPCEGARDERRDAVRHRRHQTQGTADGEVVPPLVIQRRVAGDKLTHLHVADSFNHLGSSGLRYITNPPGNPVRVHQHLDIGQGEVNWDEFFGTLGRLKFGDDPDHIMTVGVFAWEERAHESSIFMREEITKRISQW